MKRVFNHFVRPTAEVYNRSYLPWKFCAPQLRLEGIDLQLGRAIDSEEDLHDAYLFHGSVEPAMQAYMKAVSCAGRKVVWELDDNYWDLPFRRDGEIRWYEAPGINQNKALAQFVIASTPYLAGLVGAKAVVCRNLIDPDLFPLVERPERPRPVLLYAGANSIGDFGLCSDAVKRAAAEGLIDVVMLGNWKDQPETEVGGMSIPYVPTTEYHATLRSIAPDIVVAPLIGCPFNRARSELKWLEMGGMGACLLASRLEPYDIIQDGVDGILVNDGDWYEAIKEVACNHGRRRSIGAAARRRILAEHTWMTGRQPWVDAFRRIAA